MAAQGSDTKPGIRLGNVALEVESESAAAGQRVYLALQVGPELRVEPPHLSDQVGQP